MRESNGGCDLRRHGRILKNGRTNVPGRVMKMTGFTNFEENIDKTVEMLSAEMDFIAFDAQDVITTSGPKLPLAFANGNALYNGEDFFNRLKTNINAVDCLDYAILSASCAPPRM